MLGVGDQFPDGFLLNGVDRNNNMVTFDSDDDVGWDLEPHLEEPPVEAEPEVLDGSGVFCMIAVLNWLG